MSPLRYFLVLVAVLLGGCASNTELSADAAQTPAAAGGAVAAGSSDDAASDEEGAVLSMNAAALNADGSTIVCRQMLQYASNVIRRRCMSRDDWKAYERALEIRAQQMVRMLQGSPYR